MVNKKISRPKKAKIAFLGRETSLAVPPKFSPTGEPFVCVELSTETVIREDECLVGTPITDLASIISFVLQVKK